MRCSTVYTTRLSNAILRIASPKIFPGGFSTYEVFPLHRFSMSVETHPGTKNAKHLVPTREKPKMARLGKKRKIPDEASGFWLLQ